MARIELTRVAVRHYPDRKKACLVFEQGNQGIILATFRNEYCEGIYEAFLGGNCMQREMGYMFEDEGGEQ